MIKNFNNFIKESVENKGKGPGNQDLIPTAPKKQTINRSIPTMDFLRIGKHISTKKIDGFIDSVQNESIYISDRITGEIKKYTIKEVLKEFSKSKASKQSQIKESLEQKKSKDTKTIDNENIDEDIDDDEIDFDELDNENDEENIGTEDNPIGRNRGSKREMPNESWVKYWENFNKKQQDLIEDEEDDLEDYIDSKEEFEDEMEDEVGNLIGTEDNPIEARKRIKIEEYSEENPEPLPNDVAHKDDRFDQFE